MKAEDKRQILVVEARMLISVEYFKKQEKRNQTIFVSCLCQHSDEECFSLMKLLSRLTFIEAYQELE